MLHYDRSPLPEFNAAYRNHTGSAAMHTPKIKPVSDLMKKIAARPFFVQ
jgi:hypothetical protein